MTPNVLTRFCFATAAVLVVVGCSSAEEQKSPPTSSADPMENAAGRFVATYQPGTTEATQAEERLLRERRVLEDFTESMSAYVRVPRDVRVIGMECGEANAYYFPDEHAIHLCYELSAAERELFATNGVSGEALDEQVYNSAVGTLYHEAGHALIGELDLQITGREEDVADQLAAYVLTADDEFKDILLTVADSYLLNAETVASLDELPFYDTHSLDSQRAINFLCYLYGSDEQRFEWLVSEGALPVERAESCPEEYARLVGGWESLLAPHLR